MMKTFTLEIRTPEKKLFAGPVTELTARAIDGEIGILADHVPFATALAAGKISCKGGNEGGTEGGNMGGNNWFDCQRGFLFFDNGAATILLNQ